MTPPAISRPILGFLRFIVRGYFRRSFHAVRIRDAHHFTSTTGPLIVYANHGSWWDPMVAIHLSGRLLPQRAHYAPMDAEALARYRILSHIGIFPVDPNTARGAVQFLRTGQTILAADGVLWVTPQGRFVDARVRPLDFKPGMAALAERAAPCTLLPLAIEYPFWNERTPECLLQFGAPIQVQPGASLDGVLEEALLRTMEELKQAALDRSPAAFETLTAGRAGTGGFYALGQRLKALVRGRRYRPEHTQERTR